MVTKKLLDSLSCVSELFLWTWHPVWCYYTYVCSIGKTCSNSLLSFLLSHDYFFSNSFLLYSLSAILNSSWKKWYIISWNPCMFQLQILQIYVFGWINFLIIDVRFSHIFLCIRNWATYQWFQILVDKKVRHILSSSSLVWFSTFSV